MGSTTMASSRNFRRHRLQANQYASGSPKPNKVTVVPPANCTLRQTASKSIIILLKAEAVSAQNRSAAFTHHKVAQCLGGSSILGPRQDHPALFSARISVNRHLPKAALVPQPRRERNRVADDSDFRSAALDELGRLHHAVAKHEAVLYPVIDAQAFHGRLRRSAVGCMARIGDGNPAHQGAEQSLHPEGLDFNGRSPRHPDYKAPYAIQELAVGERRAFSNEPAGIVDVRRAKHLQGGPSLKPRPERSRRTLRTLDADGGALSTKSFNHLLHLQPDMRRAGDAASTHFRV